MLPKGHIENGETAEEAAAREVLEETGVTATVGEHLGDLEYYTPRGRIRARFFLMAFQSEDVPGEPRTRAWLSADDARRRLRWNDARRSIEKAAAKART